MQPIFERADAEGLPISLETMRERNVAIHGTRVIPWPTALRACRTRGPGLCSA